jgi:surface-anchored protein
MQRQLLIAGLSALVSLSASQADIATFTSGHGDLGLGEGSTLELHLHVHGDGEGEEYAPDAVIIRVPASTYDFVSGNGGRPSGSDWDGIGVAAGESYWFLPQSNSGAGGAAALSAPFLGIGAEEITLDVFDGNAFTLTLTGASMPDGGNFSLWTDGFTPTFYMSTADGISAADAFVLDLDSADHAHANWGFTVAGTYELTFTVTAAIDGIEQSDTATYTFQVVPEPSAYAGLAGAGALALVLLRRRLARSRQIPNS